jgi:AcrR family transcriptional regulator
MSKVNKHGQSMGRKGAESRRRLLDATRILIVSEAIHNISASAIARAAGLASQTFYLYFKDINEILLALSDEASADMADVHDALSKDLSASSPAERARRFVDAFSQYWDRHRPVLSMRNYLADSGHPAFLTVRQDAAMPIIEAIADRIMASHAAEDLDRRSAFARSVLIYSAIERMAARPATMRHNPGLLKPEDFEKAEAYILTLLFTPTASSN